MKNVDDDGVNRIGTAQYDKVGSKEDVKSRLIRVIILLHHYHSIFFFSFFTRSLYQGVLPLRHNVFVDDIHASHPACGNPIHHESSPRRVALFKTNVAIPP